MKDGTSLSVDSVKKNVLVVSTWRAVSLTTHVCSRISFPLVDKIFLSGCSSCSALGVAALDGRVYACGGYDGISSLSSVECYDPDTNRYVFTCALEPNLSLLETGQVVST